MSPATRGIPRRGYQRLLEAKLRLFPAVVLLGPRQCGKSTLSRALSLPRRAKPTTFDLEKPSHLARLRLAPEEDLGSLQRAPGLILIDEVQREPPLFPLLRALLDAPDRRARYLLLGSASPTVVRGVSESLAGRAGFLDLTPFLATEVATSRSRFDRLWLRGGFPRSFLARSEAASLEWRDAHLRALVERDIPALRPGLEVATVTRLLTMLAHLHGGIANESELAAGLGVTAPTVGRYLDVLEGLFTLRRLRPYHANVGKRLVKAPRIYLRDPGLLHSLLAIADPNSLRGHPKVGASFEGFVIEQVLGALALAGVAAQPFYWRTHGGAEVDLLLEAGRSIVPVEVKLSGTPTVPRGLLECMKDLSCTRGFVLHGGEGEFPIGHGVRALPATLVARPERLREALGLPRPRKPGA
ncbi:MAG TPA: ATP-binding protein [Vicinamibacteria bacterium]|nr:ATP-binding protein [Vicinamibacteria bacterium]